NGNEYGGKKIHDARRGREGTALAFAVLAGLSLIVFRQGSYNPNTRSTVERSLSARTTVAPPTGGATAFLERGSGSRYELNDSSLAIFSLRPVLADILHQRTVGHRIENSIR